MVTTCKPLLTRQQKDLLINGYVRDTANDFLPTVLIQVVHLFYNHLRSLKLEHDHLDEFLFLSKPMVTETFSINSFPLYRDIKFRMGVYPNGIRKNQRDSIEFYIKLKSMNEALERITCYYHMFEQHTQSEWKGVASLSLNEYVVWSPYLMRLSQCQQLATYANLNALFFSCDIKILALQFKNGRRTQVARHMLMNQHESYTWNVTDTLQLRQRPLQRRQFGSCLFSPNFGGTNQDNWCVKYYPEGIKRDDFRGAVFIRLLRTPPKVKTLRCRYCIYEIVDDACAERIVEEIKDFSHAAANVSHGYWLKKLSVHCSGDGVGVMQQLRRHAFQVHIDVLEIFDFEDRSVPVEQWTQFGVTRFAPF
mmetsp:Transcript_7725/g.11967  ORF Transcript_7725/g.11967 Transcript_7725/m.11967 type:complete len:364 (+) Transcript_7725:41-1132(+)|eukprot:CAMPEP_0202697542 /NCGR_PEP_ID=MMETSP1385-20130828/10888_1 /ASSEMBLY_ACC=CAM_ASM_000861 /TAXON_ID=933848 /ORGANISM="Elphidium margaritaceum" /LENGTH=363 /DNA_ID=CAMNT_0049354033 /DNA_START=38 /DNA_END=1129 /DNA_ORIENTATION=-